MKFSDPQYVLVGPLADPHALAKWAHEVFKRATVAFIAVDSGLDPLLESGLPPALVIGDLDGSRSDSGSALNPRTKLRSSRLPHGNDAYPLTFIRLKRDKDRSDLSVALDFCVAMKATSVYAFGFQGGRADHDFAVHLDLSHASARIPRLTSLGQSGAVVYLSPKSAPFAASRAMISELRQAGSAPGPSKRRAPAKSDPKQAPKSRHKKPASPQNSALVSILPIGGPAKGVKLRGLRFSPPGGIISLTSQGLSNEIRSAKVQIGLRQGRLAVFFPAKAN
jgi:thiamine pyrophosphokinase